MIHSGALLASLISVPKSRSSDGTMALHLAPHTISDLERQSVNGLTFNSSSDFKSFSTATDSGFTVYETMPLRVLSNRGDTM